MLIHVLCNDGSPLGVSLVDLWGEGKRGIGVGGSEYALLTMCEAWHNAGHKVILYNDPLVDSGSPFEQRSINSFNSNEDRDVLVNFRSPNPRSFYAKGLKVWWSCDQYSIGDYRQYAQYVNKIVCISPFHVDYFKTKYGIENAISIDLPIRVDELDNPIGKFPYRCLFSSVPDRGLDDMLRAWRTIKHEVPEASLKITSDYRLWGVGANNEAHRSKWMWEESVEFVGAIPRRQLILEQLSASILSYPCSYDELFCVSVAEAMACGCYPVTSDAGALVTTNMGKIIPRSSVNYVPTFAFAVVELLKNQDHLKQLQQTVKLSARERFNPNKILQEWDEKVFK